MLDRSPSKPKGGTEDASRTLLVLGSDRGLGATLQSGLTDAGFTLVTLKDPALVDSFGAEHVLLVQGSDLEGTLSLIRHLRARQQQVRIVVLSAFASLAAAVACVKAGACDYLGKPATLAALLRAFGVDSVALPKDEAIMTPDRVRWEYIQQVYIATGSNVSDTARRLGMHRRTLQRMLAKRAPA